MKKIILVLSLVLIAACGSKFEGTYFSASSGKSLTFGPNGSGYITDSGKNIGSFTYTLVGSSISIKDSPVPLILMEDGSINSGFGFGLLVKK
jgi:hypothetical protein